MLGLVEYNSSDDEEDTVPDTINEGVAKPKQVIKNGNSLADAKDKVEPSLVMRLPQSAQAESVIKPQNKQQPKKQSLLPPNPHLAGIKRNANGKLMVSLLSANAKATINENDNDDEDEEERELRKQRLQAAANHKQLTGGASLLALLPKPKALAVREGSAKRLVPHSVKKSTTVPTAILPSVTEPQPIPFVGPTPPTEPEAVSSDDVLSQTSMLSVPVAERQRYRQLNGTSLAVDGIREVRQDEQLQDVNVQLTKELTKQADAMAHKPTHSGPTPVGIAKRKHQITYLAYQAKEREFELKNSWSDAKFNKRTSQNKYGF